MSEGAEEAAQSALPPADLQAAGGGDERSRARLPADESLQTDDQGKEEEGEEGEEGKEGEETEEISAGIF